MTPRIAPSREQTVVVGAPVTEVFARLSDVGARRAWSGGVGHVDALRVPDPDIQVWSVERKVLARRVPVVYHVSAASPPTCVEVRASIDGAGVVTRYELNGVAGGGTSVRIVAAEFARGGRPSARVARTLHRLAHLLAQDDELLLGAAARAPSGPDLSDAARPRQNRRR